MTADALKQKILLSSAAVFSNLFQFADPLIQRAFQNSNFYGIFMKHRIVEPVGGGARGGWSAELGLKNTALQQCKDNFCFLFEQLIKKFSVLIKHLTVDVVQCLFC